MVFSSVLSDLTWQVEESVKDIKALCIISLDELVWVPFTDLRAGGKREDNSKLSFVFFLVLTNM